MKGGHPCPMCGVYLYNAKHTLSDRLYRTTDVVFRVVECRGCGLLRLDPRPEEAEMGKYYPNHYWVQGGTRQGLAGLYRRFVLRDHTRFIGEALRRMELKAGAKILDIGCGAGDLMATLRAKGHLALGMDVSQSALVSAAQVNVPAVCATYRYAPFGDGQLDLVTMFHMLEHIPDPDAAIATASRLLGPAGRIIIQVPNADCMQYAILGRFWIGLDVPRHMFAYRRMDIEQLLERNGFTVVRRKYFSWRDNAACLATSLMPWLDPMARRVLRPGRAAILRLLGDVMYFGLMCACWPVAVFEAAFRRGATIMVLAERTS